MDEFSSTIQVHDESNGERPDQSLEFDEQNIPDELPILPLRGVVVYPHTATPLTIGQARSITLVDDVVASHRLIGLVASRNPELELPGPDDLYRYGTVASIQRMLRAPDGTIRLIVRGLMRFELGEFTAFEPYLTAEIHQRPELIEESVEIEAQVRATKDLFQQISDLGPSLPREIVGGVLLLEDPLHVAYTIANYQRMDLDEGQQILKIDSTVEKLQFLTNILSREVEVLSLGQQIQQEARTEIEKVQREYFLRDASGLTPPTCQRRLKSKRDASLTAWQSYRLQLRSMASFVPISIGLYPFPGIESPPINST
jgi:ATP-dependent Lon protease